MGKVRVSAFSISLDGFGAGPDQDLEHPLGLRGEELHHWVFKTRTFHEMVGRDGGSTGTDDRFARTAMAGLGAWILGRNMFGPIRGAWADDAWKGWWGDNPPYHVPVFVLTHHARSPIAMEGDTTFHFVTDGIAAALGRARDAAGDSDIRIGGGVSTIRQYLKAGLLDELHLAVAPVLLGQGESLFAGLDLAGLGYACVGSVPGENATHVTIARQTASIGAGGLSVEPSGHARWRVKTIHTGTERTRNGKEHDLSLV